MIINMECLAGMRERLADNSVDAVVCDPPYGLSKEPDMAEVLGHWLAGDDYAHKGAGFMGKSWDSFVPGPAIWKEVFRVLKPGGYLLAFFGSRTYDLGTLAIRLAGFEIRDQIMWVYGSGFPKSLNISKAIDAAAGAEREVIGEYKNPAGNKAGGNSLNMSAVGMPERAYITAPATEAAAQWEGWGTALKPAHEPIVMARKPFKGTVAANVQEHGTGGLNIDACRVPFASAADKDSAKPASLARARAGLVGGAFAMRDRSAEDPSDSQNHAGRWPSNLVHDGSDEVVALFPGSAGARAPVTGNEPSAASTGTVTNMRQRVATQHHGDSGSAARFFYCPKASKADRNYGLTGETTSAHDMVHRKEGSAGLNCPRAGAGRTSGALNTHPTVKPIALMRWLVRLITPPGGLVLDPFVGSGSTAIAAVQEGFKFIGFEMDEGYHAIAQQRYVHALREKINARRKSRK